MQSLHRDEKSKFNRKIKTRQNMKGGICSYNGVLVFTFSSVLRDLSIEKGFFQKLAKDGITVAVESNGVFYE